jgi:hypothetical protein
MRPTPWLALTTLLAFSACKKAPPQADPEFSDALSFLFTSFESDTANLAFAMRNLEEQVYLGMDVDAEKEQDRALQPEYLRRPDVSTLEHPEDRDISNALPIAVAGASVHDIDDHMALQLEIDHKPWEPGSPNHFERTFLDGEACWGARDCDELRTDNALTKENFLMTVEYTFYKDFRWIDLNLPAPSKVPEGEEAINTGKERWAYVGRSWTPQSFEGDSGKAWIHQSYTIEIWIPRDGKGFVRKKNSQNMDDGDWEGDSTGGGVLRMLSLWTETEFKGLSVSDDTVVATVRRGIEDNFIAADEYLSEL